MQATLDGDAIDMFKFATSKPSLFIMAVDYKKEIQVFHQVDILPSNLCNNEERVLSLVSFEPWASTVQFEKDTCITIH